MDPSALPITASVASPLVSQNVAANVRNPQDQRTYLKDARKPISDTLETQDREPEGSADWSDARQATTGRTKAATTTGDLLDLNG